MKQESYKKVFYLGENRRMVIRAPDASIPEGRRPHSEAPKMVTQRLRRLDNGRR